MKAQTSFLPFATSDELRGIAKHMDTAEAVPLYYKSPDGDLLEVKTSKGILNSSQGYYVGTVSDGYSLLQNSDMLLQIADAFDALDIRAEGTVVNDYHRVALEVFFPDFTVTEIDHNKPIYMGTRIQNSYNKTSGFKGHGYLHRTWCANGAYATYCLPDMKFSEVHRGDMADRSVEILNGYIKGLDKAQDVIEMVLKVASDYKVFFDAPDQIMVTLGEWAGSKRTGQQIYQHLLKEVPGDELGISRYDIWNAFTSYASHQEGLSANVRDRINRVAESLLYPQVEAVPVDDWEKFIKPPKTSKAKKEEEIEEAEWVEVPA